MTSLAEWFDSFDSMKQSPDEAGVFGITDADMERGAAVILPIYRRLAERAGVDLHELAESMTERSEQIPRVVVARAIAGNELLGEMHAAIANTGVECFLAGIVFEQGKQLRDLLDGDAS